LAFLRKRSGQLFSKSRFIAAQFEAYLADGLWLELAKNANDAAQMLGKGVAKSANARLAFEPEANEVFAIMSGALAQKLQSEGATFYEWPVPKSHMGLLNENEKLYRLVANFGTEKAEVETFLNYLS
ncbi:MAG: low specificity L-threonine aldolase, partial [Nitratireductor sp.]